MEWGILTVWWAALRRVPALWRALLAVNLAFALLGVVLLAPLPGLVGRGLMSLSGNAALTDQAIAKALLTPFGLAALVLVLGILVAITAHDINWSLSARPPVFWLAAVMLSLVLFGGLSTWRAFALTERPPGHP